MANRSRAGWLGPVFRLECVAGARRWQLYAGRVIFITLLLVALGLVWAPEGNPVQSFRDYARLSQSFFLAVTFVQLIAVLVAGPVATAGAICVDKARGTLVHVFVTDLRDREIVLGKLGARLLTVLSLAACCLPILALVGLLGGIDPAAVLGASCAIIGVALVTCSLALLFSVWALKMPHALLATGASLLVWMLAHPLLETMGWAPSWGAMTNPIGAVIVPITEPVQFGLLAQLQFLGGCFLFSSALVGLAITRIRPVTIGQASRPARRPPPGLPARILRLLPEPPLDGNPILWREWHRKRPTRWIGRFWTAYAVVSGLASIAAIAEYFTDPGGRDTLSLASWVIAAQVCFGLLLLSISAATALAEERERGSLDVIMATPLSSRTILLGKWWGTFALVPRLLILPTWVAAAMALVTGRWAAMLVLIATILASSAVITSMGLAVSTLVSRLPRAVTISALIVTFWTFGWYFLIVALLPPYRSGGPPLTEWWSLGSPFLVVRAAAIWTGQITPSYMNALSFLPGSSNGSAVLVDPVSGLSWVLIDVWVAFLLMMGTGRSFDRCLGRIPERHVSPPRWLSSPTVSLARKVLLLKLN